MKSLLFTYGLCYGGAVASLFNPFHGLLVYICFAIIRPELIWHWSFEGGGNFSRIIAIALLVGWALNGFGNWSFGRAGLTIFALVAYWCWAAMSGVVAATDSGVALSFLEANIKIVLPFVVGMTLIDSQDKLKQLAWVILLSQGFVAWELNLSYFQGFNYLNGFGSPEAFGGMDNNCVAIAMVTGAGLAFFMGMHYEGWRRWLCFACAALIVHCIMFGYSRGGMVALIIVGVVAFILIDKSPKHFAFFALAVVVGLLLAGPEVRERFAMAFADEAERDVSAQSRIEMWGQCLKLVQENPIFGVGPDHWVFQAMHRFGWGKPKEAHSLWLQTAAEIGLPGVGFLLLFYLGTAFRLLPIARRKVLQATEWDVSVSRMVIASLVGFLVAAQFVTLEGLELPYYITMLGGGTLRSVGAWQEQAMPTSSILHCTTVGVS